MAVGSIEMVAENRMLMWLGGGDDLASNTECSVTTLRREGCLSLVVVELAQGHIRHFLLVRWLI